MTGMKDFNEEKLKIKFSQQQQKLESYNSYAMKCIRDSQNSSTTV